MRCGTFCIPSPERYFFQDSAEKNSVFSPPGLPWYSTRQRPGRSGDALVSSPVDADSSSSVARRCTSACCSAVSAVPRPLVPLEATSARIASSALRADVVLAEQLNGAGLCISRRDRRGEMTTGSGVTWKPSARQTRRRPSVTRIGDARRVPQALCTIVGPP